MSVEDEITCYFTKNKLRKSHKKILVARYLTTFSKEVEVETLWIRIRERRLDISIATVYQALNWMVELGFASRISLGRKSFYKIKEQTEV